MAYVAEDDRCSMNPDKICDNCFRCLESAAGEDYAKIKIAAVYTGDDYLLEDECATYSDDSDDYFSHAVPHVHAKTLYGFHAKRIV